MKISFPAFALLMVLLLVQSQYLLGQDEETTDQTLRSHPRKSRLLTGIYFGSYFANKYSASAYNGYGFDIYGTRNTFFNSWMYQKIVMENGGGYGQHDYIADALGVDQKQWGFSESDMPFNMHYTPAIVVGASFKIPLNDRNFLLVNVNGTKLNIEGNFTISLIKPSNPNPAITNTISSFPIKGGEQCLFFQAGFQHLFGQDDKFNFLLEGGIVGTLSKFDRNYIYINTLQIDLTYYANQALYTGSYPIKRPVGFAVGAFAGMGANIDVSSKFNVQLLYSPSYEKIAIGNNPKLKLQHGIGLRFYYKF